ncbi:hypothetical protein KBA73_04795 [Patescibacteria group bacterium]|nr:hypothetical protein [Patescibacteria group bacterium]
MVKRITVGDILAQDLKTHMILSAETFSGYQALVELFSLIREDQGVCIRKEAAVQAIEVIATGSVIQFAVKYLKGVQCEPVVSYYPAMFAKGQSSVLALHLAFERCRAIFTVNPEYLREHSGQEIVIDPVTGDYEIDVEPRRASARLATRVGKEGQSHFQSILIFAKKGEGT